jgi:hypothetical protein
MYLRHSALWSPLLLLTLGACAQGRSLGADTGSAKTDDTASCGPIDTAVEDTGEELDPWETDDDGDGYSENDGDCDDDDPERGPGVETDSCDGFENDCDDTIDEDAWEDDPYEPNDEVWTYMGDLADIDSLAIVATLHNDEDVDRYSFDWTDNWLSWWDEVTVTLTGIPDDATYRLTVGYIGDDDEISDDASQQVFGSDALSITLSDTWFFDDGGEIGVFVESIAGADCSRTYLISATDG